MNYYIRRGDIPKDERSTIGKGFGEGRIIIGYEKGVSCWRAIKDGDRWTVCYDTKCEFTGCDCINCKDKWELAE